MMIRRWLERRGHSKMVTRGRRNYLWRLYLWVTEGRTVFLHVFYMDDPDPLHNHPWWWGRIILWGRYREYVGVKGRPTVTECGPGHVVRHRSPGVFHRVELLTPFVVTLFWHGPRINTWGFMHADGFRPASDQGQDGRPFRRRGLFPRKVGPPPTEIPNG